MFGNILVKLAHQMETKMQQTKKYTNKLTKHPKQQQQNKTKNENNKNGG